MKHGKKHLIKKTNDDEVQLYACVNINVGSFLINIIYQIKISVFKKLIYSAHGQSVLTFRRQNRLRSKDD